MTKREFVMQYILNRARGCTGSYHPGDETVKSVSRLWEKIDKEAPLEMPPLDLGYPETYEDCPVCCGSGVFMRKTCTACHGKGSRKSPEYDSSEDLIS